MRGLLFLILIAIQLSGCGGNLDGVIEARFNKTPDTSTEPITLQTSFGLSGAQAILVQGTSRLEANVGEFQQEPLLSSGTSTLHLGVQGTSVAQ